MANYNASMDPTTWLNNYEMGMSILNTSEEICARYLNMMLEEGVFLEDIFSDDLSEGFWFVMEGRGEV